MRRLIFSTALAAMAMPALAEDAALLMGIERYRSLDRFVGGTGVTDAAQELTDAGYAVDALSNQSASAMRQMLTRFQARSTDADRLIVAMSGRFATDGERNWLLATNAKEPDFFGVEEDGLSVESVMKVLATVPGQAILLLGYDKGEKANFDNMIREGIGELDIPQGVTVIIGDPRNLTNLIEETIVRPNAEVVSAVASNRNITLFGFRPNSLVMQATTTQVEPTEPRPYVVDRAAEIELWQRAVQTDTIDSYRSYLRVNPRGAHAAEANEAIRSIQSEPNRAARFGEDALNLTRDQRRGIQRDLSILNYNTRGIDGIFGNGTRTAISNWQQENGFSQTGYVTDEQVTRINAQSARRSAQLEAEAVREREAQVRRDRAYWEETGANGREPGLRSYLDRYPDGVYAEQAKAQLSRFEENKLAQAARADRDAWTVARNRDTVESYQAYLKDQRRGSFRDEAEARLAALRRQQSDAPNNDRAWAEEEALNLNPLARRLIEGRLTQLRLDPGPADGQFDDKTRRAIRQFQRSRNLEPTGYISQAALVQLLVRIGN